MYTLTVIKADTGGFVGHCTVHPATLRVAEERLSKAKAEGVLIDYCVGKVGDDIALIMTHNGSTDEAKIHQLAWETFQATTLVAKELKLYGAGQDLLKDAFSGNIKGLGPGIAELSFEERGSEPVIVFLADKTEPGAWNWPLYKMFADPFNTPGLVIDPKMHDGFTFEVLDLIEHRSARFNTPEEIYDLLLFIGAPGRYAIRAVYQKGSSGPVAATSTQRLNLLAGRYVGKDDPVMIVRCQSGLPAVGEALEPFGQPHIVAGWMRGSHHGPLMPVSFEQDTPSRFDGPPRAVAYGFQLCQGKLVGPRDMFADPSFDTARRQALEVADYLRRLGPFEPHRLPLDEMEYTTMPQVMTRLADRFVPVEETEAPAANVRPLRGARR